VSNATQGMQGKISKLLLEKPGYRPYPARMGGALNRQAMKLLRWSRGLVRVMNPHVTDAASDWFVVGLRDLHVKIDDLLRQQRNEYGKYYYFYGFPYQSLGILGVFGERGTEERFATYGLRDLIGKEDSVLDIGCNCGFMALYTSFRTGCYAEGIDINPYMTGIGNLCAEYLKIDDRARFRAVRIQEYVPGRKFSVVFSFATHWTDDENYRVPIREHFERCASYLEPGGLLVFETHAADVGNEEFYRAIEGISDIFETISKKDTDNATRHLYIFKHKHPVG